MHSTRIDIPEKNRKDLTELLNQQLADLSDLVSQVKQAHWNVKGIHFIELHKLFDDVYGALIGYVDEIAERVTTLGGTAMGTVRMAAKSSALSEYPTKAKTGEDHLEAVADRLGAYANATREGIEQASSLDDPLTEDLLTEIGRVAELQLYFIESHLTK